MQRGSPDDLAARAKATALALGFDRAGVARLAPTAESRFLPDWLARGFHGEMAYLARNVEKRVDPRALLDGSARSALVVSLIYDQPPLVASRDGGSGNEPHPPSGLPVGARALSTSLACGSRSSDEVDCPGAIGAGASAGAPSARIAKYAGGPDYHDVLLDRLKAVGTALEAIAARPMRWRAYVDTGPLLERVLAAEAGLGWIGKNTCLIDPALGSYAFLGVLISDLELSPDAREPDHCGTCRACLDACPTGAFPEPYVLDASRCLSYTTIELRGAIPEPLRAAQGDWVFGCDVCQDVCPWNLRTRRVLPDDRGGLRTALARHESWKRATLAWLLDLDENAWRAASRRTALRRAKRRGLVRNAIVAAGNAGDASLRPALERHASGSDPLLAEHARWALARLD
jgi:epoxyqueuosine reductase